MGFWKIRLNTEVRRRMPGGVLVLEWIYLVHRAVREHNTYCVGVRIRGVRLAGWEGASLSRPGDLLC